MPPGDVADEHLDRAEPERLPSRQHGSAEHAGEEAHRGRGVGRGERDVIEIGVHPGSAAHAPAVGLVVRLERPSARRGVGDALRDDVTDAERGEPADGVEEVVVGGDHDHRHREHGIHHGRGLGDGMLEVRDEDARAPQRPAAVHARHRRELVRDLAHRAESNDQNVGYLSSVSTKP